MLVCKTGMVAPAISVVLAVRNGARDLPAALRSVLEPPSPDLEVVVVDDGSVDGTAGVIEEWRARDPRVRLVRLPTVGLARALNAGIAAARGRYIARQDADDESVPGRLAAQLAHLEAHPRVLAVGASADVIDDHGRVVGRLSAPVGAAAVREGLWRLRSTPVHGAMMLRREALLVAGGYRDAFQAGQDYDLWLRLAERGDLDNLPGVWYRWRLSREGVYTTRRAAQLRYAGIARMFAWQRARTGADSYDALAACDGDLERFASTYPHAAALCAWWAELLYRAGGNSGEVRRLFRRAVAGGVWWPRVAALGVWAHLGLPWPGGRTLARASTGGPA